MNSNKGKIQKKVPSKVGPFFIFPLQTVWEKTNKRKFIGHHGQVAYEVVGKTYVVAGDPLAESLEKQILALQEFTGYVHSQGGCVCGYYFSKPVAQGSDLEPHMLGVSRLLDLKSWSLQGGQSEEFRRALRKGEQADLKIEELSSIRLQELECELLKLDRSWRKTKAPFRIEFLLTPFAQTLEKASSQERFFICWQQKEVASLVSVRPYGSDEHRGWYVDHLIQNPRAHKYAIDYLLANVFLCLQEEGAHEVSLGLCPLIVKKSHKSPLERLIQVLSHCKFIYSAKGLYTFKRKYTNLEHPRFLLMDPQANRFKQLFALERVSFKIPG